jgi:hypothetical protein
MRHYAFSLTLCSALELDSKEFEIDNSLRLVCNYT